MDSLTIHISDLERIMRKWGATPGDWRHFFADLKEAGIKSGPDWASAPDWANFLAMDADGYWFWYENIPVKKNDYWYTRSGSVERCYQVPGFWGNSLQRRPQNKAK